MSGRGKNFRLLNSILVMNDVPFSMREGVSMTFSNYDETLAVFRLSKLVQCSPIRSCSKSASLLELFHVDPQISSRCHPICWGRL